MTTTSAPVPADSEAISAWEHTLSRKFKRWNDEAIGRIGITFVQRILAALNHSLSPFTAAQGDYVFTSITQRFPSDMDLNQWYDMLREGRWYGVVEQILPTKKGTPSYATDEDWEMALRRRFTGWKVDLSGDDTVKKVLGPCIKDRILKALELPCLTVSRNQRDTIRRVVENMDEKTITEVFEMLNAGDWLNAMRRLTPLSPYDEDITIRSSLEDIVKHWDDDYQGRALVALLNRLKQAEKNFGRTEKIRTANKGATSGQYAKTLDIVQSSGMGKSRLVSEMAKKVMSISFVLRKPGETGFPPGDTEVFDFLLEGSAYCMQDAHKRAMCLLGGTFFVSQYSSILPSWYQADVTVAKWCKSKSTSNKKLDFATLLEKWNHAMSPLKTPLLDETDRRNPARVQLYKSIIKRAQKYQKELETGIISNRKLKRSESEPESSDSDPESSDSDPESSGSELGRKWNWKKDLDYQRSQAFIQIVETPLCKLFKHIPASDDSLPTLVIAFDESANLYKEDSTNPRIGKRHERKEVKHTAIRRVLRGLRHHALWTIFMSTSSRIEVFLPSQENDGSGRIVHGILHRGQPFCCFELDIECNMRVHQRSEIELNKKIRKFASVDHMTMFGRPLWRLYASESYEKLLAFVIMKMLGGNTEFSDSNLHHVFTAVASRVCIDPCLNTEKSIQFSREAVENHLRLLIGIDLTSGMLKTATPSEPVVAEAAATLLVCNDGKTSDMTTWTTCIQMLSEKLLAGGIIDKGTKGELFGRLLCILARDQLPDGLSTDKDFRYSRPFKVKMFLDELLGDGAVTRHIDREIERRRTGRATKRTLPFGDKNLDFREGWCNFNHFTYTTEKLPTNLEELQDLIRRLLRRNAALQLSPRQPDWDLLLPVYTGSINKPIQRDHLTAIFVQIKNRHQPEKLTLGTEYLGCFRPEQLGFCIQMEFGASFRPPLARMRWPIRASEPFVFGMQVFGANWGTFPFLAKYPALDAACGNLVRNMETLSEYPDEPPILQSLNGAAMKQPIANARSGLRYGGASRGGVGGDGADEASMSDGLGVGDDMDEDGDDTEDDGGEEMDDDGKSMEDDDEDDTEDDGLDDMAGWNGDDSPISGME